MKKPRSVSVVSCGICDKEIPAALANDHHIHPKEAGGQDTKDNLIWLDPFCHQTLHRVAERLKTGDVGDIDVWLGLCYPNARHRKRLLAFAKKATIETIRHQKFGAEKQEINISLTLRMDSYQKLAYHAALLSKSRKRESIKSLAETLLTQAIQKLV